MGKIYLLEQRKFYYIDVNDNENVEDNFIIGYFTADKIKKKTIALIKEFQKRNYLWKNMIFNSKKIANMFIF